ncbi:Aspartate ammonia-lyase [Pelotomaculum schinkii]|uniref:Aspartate ammonia-lyase n=1 Tax=Pelotomaculum schinkii TaxID=78350 RepID=A0A4Y7RFB9_9FIRM|nr:MULTISPECIES: aspartate ammonia-lyase [Pelotomaculum]TEB07017.1 Aspartate ammonia-lyase [Pelotomaculum schinkii]TEB16930.1 Aspartate ammonia-lyase [Pelotomaculum sp. FP]
MEFRIEKDMLGEVKVPQAAYYGIHTVRAAGNFPVSGFKTNPFLIRAVAQVKQAAAEANMSAGLLDRRIGEAIVKAAGEVAGGGLSDQFIVDAFQGGAGTSTNMNVNEVIANRAIELLRGQKGDYLLVDPLEHVNLSQSTNDVYPTALRVAAIGRVLDLSEVLADLQGALQEKEASFAGILKIGRTEMQDAVPVTLGQEFSAYAEAIARDRWRLYKVEERLRQVNLGGTAVGTGLNANPHYIYSVIEELRAITGYGLARSENTIDLTQNTDVFVEVSGLLKAAAVNLAKMAGDLRLLSSGPLGGLAEIKLPEIQAGSSIMPGKVNPVIPEMITQVSFQVMGNDQVLAAAAAAGSLELNAFMPVIAHTLLQSLEMLINAVNILNEKCVKGIMADEARCRRWLEESHGFITALTPHLGYGQAAELVKQARRESKNLREVVIESGLFTSEDLAAIFTPGELTRPGVAGTKYLKKGRDKR